MNIRLMKKLKSSNLKKFASLEYEQFSKRVFEGFLDLRENEIADAMDNLWIKMTDEEKDFCEMRGKLYANVVRNVRNFELQDEIIEIMAWNILKHLLKDE